MINKNLNKIIYIYYPFYQGYECVTVEIINKGNSVELICIDSIEVGDWTIYKDSIIKSFLESFNDNYERET